MVLKPMPKTWTKRSKCGSEVHVSMFVISLMSLAASILFSCSGTVVINVTPAELTHEADTEFLRHLKSFIQPEEPFGQHDLWMGHFTDQFNEVSVTIS